MSIEGLWTAEFYGLHGWENTGVFVFQNGRVLGGGRHHYSVGVYEETNNEVNVSVTVTYHGKPRVMFGSSDRTLTMEFKGQHHENMIEGNVNRAGNPRQTLLFRMTKRAEIV